MIPNIMLTKPALIAFGLRLLMAMSVGLVVYFLCLNAGWQMARSSFFGTSPEQGQTQNHIANLALILQEYQEEHGHLPDHLEELFRTPEEQAHFLQDGWGRPFLYSRTEDSFELLSYGRDGQPGGIGLDADLSDQAPRLRHSNITYEQYYAEPVSAGMNEACLLIAFLGGGGTFLLISQNLSQPREWFRMIFKLVVLAMVTYAVSIVMLALHIPSGH